MFGLLVSLPLVFAQAPAPSSSPAPTGGPSAPAAAPTAPAPAAQPAAAPTAAPATAPAPGQPAPKAAEPPANPFGSLIVFLPVIVLFYFMILRPQQRQDKKRRETVDKAERNTRVMTTGGMYGTIVSVDKDANTVLIRLGSDPGVKVEFARSAIAQVIDAGDKDKKEREA